MQKLHSAKGVYTRYHLCSLQQQNCAATSVQPTQLVCLASGSLTRTNRLHLLMDSCSVKRFKSYLPHHLSLKHLSADGCFSLSGDLCVLLFLITFYLTFIIKAFFCFVNRFFSKSNAIPFKHGICLQYFAVLQ